MNIYDFPEKLTGDELRADQTLYNDLVDYLDTTDARWPRQKYLLGRHLLRHYQMPCGILILTMLPYMREVLVCLFHFRRLVATVIARGKRIKTRMTQSGLDQHVQTLCKFLLHPWFCHSKYFILCTHTEKLVSGMKRYEKFLQANSRA